MGEEVTLEIFAVTSTILRVLRAFDFFNKSNETSSLLKERKAPRYGCGAFRFNDTSIWSFLRP
ncbi:MAG TPA: hypothetical protein VNI60_10980 [Pyrinomonadaceae bacterium]|nr:hypothetical protein [Pyrinomonadaceae bacterium]